MRATVVDLRYKMRDVLEALERREKVEILYHGKIKGVIIPVQGKTDKIKVEDHPFFGMEKDDTEDVDSIMKSLRGGRYNDI